MPCQCGCIAAWARNPVRMVRHLHECDEYRLIMWYRREAEIRLNVDAVYVRCVDDTNPDFQPIRWQ